MSEQKNVRVLSQQEIDEIMALPDRSFLIAGIERKGKFNEETGVFYLLNDDGTLNGRIAKTVRRDRPPDEQTVEETKKENQKLPDGPEEKKDKPAKVKAKGSLVAKLHKLAGDTEYSENKTSEADELGIGGEELVEEQPKPKRSFGKIACVIGLVAVLAIAAIAAFPKDDASPDTPSDPTETVSTPDATLKTIAVIQVTSDLVPGDYISEDNVQQADISAETYNQIYLSSSKLYQWSRCEALMGDRVVTYIPRGQYLSYDNVASVYLQPANPWMPEAEGTAYVMLPLTDEVIKEKGINYGSIVNLSVTKQTVKEIETEEEGEEVPRTEVPGLDHQMSVQQSYIVDTYGLSNIVICDLLNSDKESLYPAYTSWMSIPTGERLTYVRDRFNADDGLAGSMAPAYAMIRITTEQAAELGDLTGDNIKVTFGDNAGADTDTDIKASYAAEATALRNVIAEAIQLNREAKEAEKNAD